MILLEAVRAARDSGLSAVQRHVLIALASYADRQGRCWPSLATLAGGTGLSLTAIKESLAALETAGWITRRRRRERGSRECASTYYTVTIDRGRGRAPGGQPRAPGGQQVGRQAARGRAPGGQELSIEETNGTTHRAHARGRGGPGASHGGPEGPEKVAEAYRVAYLAARGEAPPEHGLVPAARRLLAAVDGDEARALHVIRAAYADPYWAPRATLRGMAADPARFLGAAAASGARGPRHAAGVQPASGRAWTPAPTEDW